MFAKQKLWTPDLLTMSLPGLSPGPGCRLDPLWGLAAPSAPAGRCPRRGQGEGKIPEVQASGQTVDKPLCCLYQADRHPPQTDFPVSLFLGEHGCSPPGEGHGCPFDGLKKAGGSKGTRPLGRPLGLGGKDWPKSPPFAAGAKHPACIVALGAFFSFNGL